VKTETLGNKVVFGHCICQKFSKKRKSHQIAILDSSKYLARISKDDSTMLFIFFFFIHDLQPDKWLKIPRQDYNFFQIFMSTNATKAA